MTVEESSNRDLKSGMDLKNNNKLKASDRFLMKKRLEELESEQESGGSSAEEIESPKSVWKSDWRQRRRAKTKTSPIVHHQVLKIREEDSLIGDEIGEGLSANDFHQLRSWHNHHNADAAILFSRPSSPLSGNRQRVDLVMRREKILDSGERWRDRAAGSVQL